MTLLLSHPKRSLSKDQGYEWASNRSTTHIIKIFWKVNSWLLFVTFTWNKVTEENANRAFHSPIKPPSSLWGHFHSLCKILGGMVLVSSLSFSPYLLLHVLLLLLLIPAWRLSGFESEYKLVNHFHKTELMFLRKLAWMLWKGIIKKNYCITYETKVAKDGKNHKIKFKI